jgi:glycosyltransferase involved in cell wall biosynthesis
MKILFVCESFWPAIGGVETRARHFLPAMRDRGHEIQIVTTRDADDNLPERDHISGVPILRLPLRTAFAAGDFQAIVALKRKYAAIKSAFAPDLVHGFFSGVIMILEACVAATPDVPLLASFTMWPCEADKEPDSVVGRMLSRAACVTANSARLRDRLCEIMPPARPRSIVVYSGNPWPAAAPAPLPSCPPVLLCIGRLMDTKGFDLAIRALPGIIAYFPAVRLRIAGDGPALAACAALAQSLGIAASVEFLGWVHPDAISALINQASIVIVPSRWEEAFASVAIHAAQMARPVIAARCGGMAEAVADGETGILVAREDTAAITAAVLRLLNNLEAAAAMGARGRERAAACIPGRPIWTNSTGCTNGWATSGVLQANQHGFWNHLDNPATFRKDNAMTIFYKLNEPVIAADVIDGEAVIMNLLKGHYYSLVETGADVWSMLMLGWSAGQAAQAIAEHYRIDPAAVAADVERFIGLLVAEDILIVSDATPAAAAAPAAGMFTCQAGEYQSPSLSTFSDIKDLLALDPPLPDYYSATAR